MTVALSSYWEEFVVQQVEAGLFQSEQEVLEASLALMEQRQAKLEALRANIAASEARGDSFFQEHILVSLQTRAYEMRSQGH